MATPRLPLSHIAKAGSSRNGLPPSFLIEITSADGRIELKSNTYTYVESKPLLIETQWLH